METKREEASEADMAENEVKLEKVKRGKILFQKGWKGGPGRPKESAETKLLKQAAREVAMRILERGAPTTAKKLVKLSQRARSEQVQLGATDSILDRLGVGIQNKNMIVPIQINFRDKEME